MAHYEHVVGLLERHTLLDHQTADTRAAMVAEVAMELLDPRLRGNLGSVYRFHD